MNDFEYQGMVILGASGNIGTRLIERVTESDYPKGEHFLNAEISKNKNPIPHEHPTKIIAIADSTHFYVDIIGISSSLLRETKNTRNNVKNILARKGTEHFGDLTLIGKFIKSQIEDSLKNQKKSILEEKDIGYVDLTDSKRAQKIYEYVLNKTDSTIVAVSKEVLGNTSKQEFDRFISTGRVELKPTVGAGIDAVEACSKYPESRENLQKIEAMISGTNLGICKKLESEAYLNGEFELSDLVKEFYEAGDTEPYAHKDIGALGTDTQNKIRIMAMMAGFSALVENIQVGMPFVPQSIGEKFDKHHMDEYMEAIKTKVDASMRKFVKENVNDAFTIRHIAEITVDKDGKEKISIGLKKISRTHEFANSDQNVIIIQDSTETEIFKKAGAGRDVTCKSIEQAFRNIVPKGLPRIKTDEKTSLL